MERNKDKKYADLLELLKDEFSKQHTDSLEGLSNAEKLRSLTLRLLYDVCENHISRTKTNSEAVSEGVSETHSEAHTKTYDGIRD